MGDMTDGHDLRNYPHAAASSKSAPPMSQDVDRSVVIGAKSRQRAKLSFDSAQGRPRAGAVT
jgi:hypothetical protein